MRCAGTDPGSVVAAVGMAPRVEVLLGPQVGRDVVGDLVEELSELGIGDGVARGAFGNPARVRDRQFRLGELALCGVGTSGCDAHARDVDRALDIGERCGQALEIARVEGSACGLAAPGSCGEQSLAGTLERAVGGQVVVERAGRNVTELAADLWN